MLVNATDLKNNLGRYLREAMCEEIIVASSGHKVARLTASAEPKSQPSSSLKNFGAGQSLRGLPEASNVRSIPGTDAVKRKTL